MNGTEDAADTGFDTRATPSLPHSPCTAVGQSASSSRAIQRESARDFIGVNHTDSDAIHRRSHYRFLARRLNDWPKYSLHIA